MKKKSTSFIYILAVLLLMDNCKQKDADPLVPNQALIEDLNKIEMETVVLAKPEPVAATESRIEISAKAAALSADIAAMNTTGIIPASVKIAADETTTAITAAEIAALETITPEMITAMAAGGALPANLQLILNKAAGNAALLAYLPKIIFPTVAGAEIKGARIGTSDLIEKTGATNVSDACLTAAEDVCQAVKTKLKTSLNTQLGGATAAFDNEVASLASMETSRTAALILKYSTLRTQTQLDANKLKLLLDAAKNLAGTLYSPVKAQIFLQLLGYFNTINILQEADKKAYIAKTTAATINAQTYRKKNMDAIEAAYAKALALVEKAKADIAQSCHNQGGGK